VQSPRLFLLTASLLLDEHGDHPALQDLRRQLQQQAQVR
jgi:hypothetical protein